MVERLVVAIVVIVAVFGVCVVEFMPSQLVEVNTPRFVQINFPVTYKPLPKNQVNLDQKLLNEISQFPLSDLQLQEFKASFNISEKNNKKYSFLVIKDKNYTLPLSDLQFSVVTNLYSNFSEDNVSFSNLPYGLLHFNTTAPVDVPEGIREKALSVLNEAGLNRREIVRGTLALNTIEEKKVAWYLIANLAGVGFETETGLSIPDMYTMNAQTFYETVKYSVLAWHSFPWAQKLSFDDFVKYILPQRTSKEPLQSWRKLFFEALRPAISNFSNEYDAAKFVHETFMHIVRYDGDTFWEDQGMLTMLQTHQGRSGEMANLQAALMRSVGLRSGEMIMDWWPKANGNHGYNYVIVNQNGTDKFVFFDDQSWDVPIAQYSAKSYASTTFNALQDMTSEQTIVTNLSLKLNVSFVEAYLNVFNNGGWATIHKSETTQNNTITFNDVGNKADYLYSISYDPYSTPDDNGTTLALPPFILHANSTNLTFLLLEPQNSTNDKLVMMNLTRLKPWTKYTLSRYSIDGFVQSSQFMSNGLGNASIKQGKERRLYVLTKEHDPADPPYHRPFAYLNGTINFY